TTVTVWYGGRHRTVVLSDYEASLVPGRVIDLDGRTFAPLVGSGWLAPGIANALYVAVGWSATLRWEDLPPELQVGWRRAEQRVRDTLSAELNAERECAR